MIKASAIQIQAHTTVTLLVRELAVYAACLIDRRGVSGGTSG
jgi:hypothetical protein